MKIRLAIRRRWMSNQKDLPNQQVFFCADYFAWIVDIAVMHNYYLIQREHKLNEQWSKTR